MNNQYVLITAAKDEDKYIQKTIDSVISQTIKPVKWIVVSDRSTDNTDIIIKKAANQFDFIELIVVRGDNTRNFGSQVRAINKGYEYVHNSKYNFIGNLDADVSFGSRYFELLFEKFIKYPKLGLCGGFICEEINGKFIGRPTNNLQSVPHAIQMFRKECYEAIGGYMPLKYGGPDWLAEIMVRMNGWEVASFPELEVHHHRLTTSAEGYLHGAFRSGRMDHTMGSHPLFEILKCFRRVKSRPFLFNSIARLSGFLYGYIKTEPRMVPEEVSKYLKEEQINRMKEIFLFKNK